jgi:uncharacterized protein (UPF0332 family)
MSFQWQHFLELADELVETDREAYRRSAISRAYYAAYHAGRRRWAQDQGLPTTRRIEHAPLWEYFRRSPGGAALGEKGRRLLELRRSADYDAAPECSARDAQRALVLARELLVALV